MKDIVILGAVRTAIGAFGKSLQEISAAQLGEIVVREALKRAGVSADQVDDVVFGCVLQGGLGQNVARQVAVRSGLPVGVSGITINQVCGSGLRSVMMGAQAIQAGDAEIVVTGGCENMSRAPFVMDGARWGARMGHSEVRDMMIHDGLWDAFHDIHMGITAENVAEQYGISREEQDRFALTSQERAAQAIASGAFNEEIVPVEIPQRKGAPVVFATDEHPRATTLEKLGELKPAFKKGGSVTAGNASGINDGAAALILASAEKAHALGLKPLAFVRGYATAGVDPKVMGIGPIPASKKALAKAGWGVGQLDLIEANEAFAAQALAVVKELELDPAKTNVHGGAIALGHPIGASGARILVTLLHALKQRGQKRGLATLCIGGGMGASVVVEMA